MGRVTFSTENKKATTNYDYPKLKLKQGESARILLLEDSPVVEYVHTLNKPTIVGGKPVTIVAERKDGSKYNDFKMDFISRPICLGDETVLDDKGSDPKNCPICALAKENPDAAKAPQRRFAMHVIRYKTKPGGATLVTPYSVETVVWAFTDRMFGKIVDFKEEWGDLRKHDLIMGPCTNEMFQQFDISVGSKAAWLEDKARQKLTAETFKENQIEDLSIACGTRKEKRWIDEDIKAIKDAWAQANDAPAEIDTTISADLDGGLDDLLGGGSDKGEKTEGSVDDLFGDDKDAEGWSKTAPGTAPDDFMAGLDLDDAEGTADEAAEAPAKPAAKTKAAAKPAPEPVADEGDDLDDLDALLNLDD
jgi:hypothetical protein